MYIFGAGGHTKQCIDIFEYDKKIIGIFDDKKVGYHYGYPIIDTIENAKKYIDTDTELFIGIGDNHIRNKVYKIYKNYNFINCISNKNNICSKINLGKGNYFGANVSILADSKIGNFNIFNENCVIPHDCSVGNFNHISIMCTFGGNVKIGNYNLIGLNTTIIPNIYIGDHNIIGAGSVIIKNIDNNSKVVGNPGRHI